MLLLRLFPTAQGASSIARNCDPLEELEEPLLFPFEGGGVYRGERLWSCRRAASRQSPLNGELSKGIALGLEDGATGAAGPDNVGARDGAGPVRSMTTS